MERNLALIKERILYLSDLLKVRKIDFFESIGQTYGNFKGENLKSTSVNSDVLERLVHAYPQVSTNWLITGEGDPLIGTMHVKMEDIQPIKSKGSRIQEQQVVFLYEFEATANLITPSIDVQNNPIGAISIPNMPTCDGAIQIRGESMTPILNPGDIVAFKAMPIDFSCIFFGDLYIVSFQTEWDSFIVVKYIEKSKKKGHIRLTSANPRHEPKDIPISSITALASVKFSIRNHTM